jgi:hypothetical protein
MIVQSFLVLAALLGQTANAPMKNRGLYLQLEKMVKQDQDLRQAMAQRMREGKPIEPSMGAAIARVDVENTGRLRQIVKTYGWPTYDLVGKQGADWAWLLVQHSDHAPAFQRECLDLMTPLLAKRQVTKQNYAYLTDRVLLAEGKKQLYATQFVLENGVWNPKPLEDPDNVEKRRAEMGLGTLAEYRKLLEEFYGKKPPPLG